MALLELHYMTARGAGVCRYLRDEESTLRAVKALAKRHIDARIIDYQTREEIGSVEETPEGKWIWWFWSGVFRPVTEENNSSSYPEPKRSSLL